MSKLRRIGFPALSALLLTGCIALCIALGSVPFTLRDVLGSLVNVLSGQDLITGVAPTAIPILWTIRAPRVLLGGIVGASLAVAGAAMQGLIRNPLADGSTLGVTSGASLGAVLTISMGITLPFISGLATTAVSILSAFVSLMLILSFSHRVDANLSSHTIIMSGIVFSMLASSIVSLIIAFADDHLRNILFWTMGSFSGRGWTYLLLMVIFAIPGLGILLFGARELDAFAMGEEQAAYAGVDIRKTRLRILIAASVLCGASVSVAGSIAFVGLVVPHIVRLVSGPAHTRLLPGCAVVGAVFLMLCDLLARTIAAPLELPIGIITSIFGALAFLHLFYKRRSR